MLKAMIGLNLLALKCQSFSRSLKTSLSEQLISCSYYRHSCQTQAYFASSVGPFLMFQPVEVSEVLKFLQDSLVLSMLVTHGSFLNDLNINRNNKE